MSSYSKGKDWRQRSKPYMWAMQTQSLAGWSLTFAAISGAVLAAAIVLGVLGVWSEEKSVWLGALCVVNGGVNLMKWLEKRRSR